MPRSQSIHSTSSSYTKKMGFSHVLRGGFTIIPPIHLGRLIVNIHLFHSLSNRYNFEWIDCERNIRELIKTSFSNWFFSAMVFSHIVCQHSTCSFRYIQPCPATFLGFSHSPTYMPLWATIWQHSLWLLIDYRQLSYHCSTRQFVPFRYIYYDIVMVLG